MKQKLFSIGVLAKISGVHIRSLRYYEKLGILKPAYIEKETGYRYYTYRQMRVVEAIQYCVELDIPLKKFTEFSLPESGEIDYASLVEYGKQVTEEKMQKILQRKKFMEEVSEEILRGEKLAQTEQTVEWFAEKYFYCLPYNGSQESNEFQLAIVNLINDLESKGLKAGYNTGLISTIINGKQENYCFIDIKGTAKDLAKYPEIIKIPSGQYLCVIASESSILKAETIFKRQISQAYNKFIIESELCLEKFNYEKPRYELKCYLGK